jgi:hypothetical protein
MAFEDNKGKIDFEAEASSTDEEKGWSRAEKQELFNYLLNNGVPLTSEGRSNWVEIREAIKTNPTFAHFDKSISQVEKIVKNFTLFFLIKRNEKILFCVFRCRK